MDWEFLIPLLMFAFPVVVALLDKRAKQKRAASPPPKPSMHRPSPISFEEFAREFSPEAAGRVAPENRSHPRLRKREGPADEVSGRDEAKRKVSRGLPCRPLLYGMGIVNFCPARMESDFRPLARLISSAETPGYSFEILYSESPDLTV